MKFIIQYKNQYIKVKANEKYFHIDKSYRFTSIKNMKNIINKIKEYIYMYIKYVPYNNNPKYYKDSVNCSIFYIPINKIITKWLINNICYYLHINKNKNYLLTESNREELKIEFINKIDDFVVNQYYINCATENGTIGYPIHYCPICGEKLK